MGDATYINMHLHDEFEDEFYNLLPNETLADLTQLRHDLGPIRSLGNYSVV